METKTEPTQRFSATVDNYVKYRPNYPSEILNIIHERCGFSSDKITADIGAGTGIFTKMLLENGNQVFTVEPNVGMRQQADKQFLDNADFISIAGSADTTTLAPNSVDFIFSAQAFHWFEPNSTRHEFQRILKANGYVVLLWNMRSQQSELMTQYEQLLIDYGTDYQTVAAERITDQNIEQFFAPAVFEKVLIPHQQTMDWQAFQGRLLSTSYTPKSGEVNFETMMTAAENIFTNCQQDNQVHFLYDTTCYFGQLTD